MRASRERHCWMQRVEGVVVQEPKKLTRRIERLEREARRWRCAAVILGGMLGIIGLVGATTAGPVPVAEEIRARRFVLVDDAGRVRGEFGPLALNDLDGSQDEGASVTLRDGQGQSRFYVGVRDAETRMWLMTPGSRSGIFFNALENGGVGLVLSGRSYEPDGTATVFPTLPTNVSAEQLLQLAEKASRRTNAEVTLSVDKDDRAVVSVQDAHTQRQAVLGAVALESPRTGSVEQRPASSLVLYDKDGQVLFKAP